MGKKKRELFQDKSKRTNNNIVEFDLSSLICGPLSFPKKLDIRSTSTIACTFETGSISLQQHIIIDSWEKILLTKSSQAIHVDVKWYWFFRNYICDGDILQGLWPTFSHINVTALQHLNLHW